MLGDGPEVAQPWGTEHWCWQAAAKSKGSCSNRAQTLLGPMAGEAPKERGLENKVAPQDDSVSDGESLGPGGWGQIGPFFAPSGTFCPNSPPGP